MRTSHWTRSAAALGGRLFAGTCYLCRGDSQGILCAQCNADLPTLARPRCPQCALSSPAGKRCGRCLADLPAFDATTAVFAYAFPADVLVQGLKFGGELALASLLADALHEDAANPLEPVDCLVPVPLHEARLRGRGYNQSMEIARALARLTGVPVAPDLCMRVRDTAAQLDLPWKERRDNVRNAFSCRRAMDGKRVAALVDDVMTTGSTLNEVASTLKKFGASRVVNWVVVRTPME